jgi:cysteinyl-tRNA synthetase
VRRHDAPDDERRWLVLDADRVLGLDLDLVWETAGGGSVSDAGRVAVPDDVRALVEVRSQARADRDWPAADAARDALATMGWDVTDGPDGPVVSPRRD